MNSLEIAKKMETDAILFYVEAAGKTKHSAGKKMFESIAEDEKRHVEMISQVIEGLQITPQDATPISRVKTVFESLRGDMMSKIEASEDELEALNIAMQMEKEGVEFYKQLLSETKSEKEKALFQRLIHEEEQHYTMFSNTYQFLLDTGNWFMWEQKGIVEG